MAKKLPICAHSECENTFAKRNLQHKTCSWQCAMAYTKEVKAERAAKDKRKAVKEFNQNDKAYLMKIAQQAFNKYIRFRDRGNGCISCGNHDRQIHAGHFMSVGGNGHIRFDEANCHAQCSICNNHKSGNLSEYEPNLIFKIGAIEVERLKTKKVKVWTVEELKVIIDTYRAKTKELEEDSTL